jgi:hypothetical protein
MEQPQVMVGGTMRRIAVAAAAGAIVMGMGACDGGSDPGGGTQVRDSAGVRLVTSRPDYSRLTFDSAPELQLGGERSPLGLITSGSIVSDTAIALVDQYSEGIGLRLMSGDSMGTFATRGDGPGEFRSIAGVIRYSPGGLLAVDVGVSRAAVFSETGELEEHFQRSWQPGVDGQSSRHTPACCTLVGSLDDGRLILKGPDRVPSPVRAPVTGSAPIFAWSPVTNRGDLIASVRSGEYLPPPGDSRQRQSRIEPHFNLRGIAAATDAFIAVADGRVRGVEILDASGKLRARTRVLADREPLTPDMSSEVTSRIEGRIQELGRGRAEASGLTGQLDRPLPDSFPAYNRILASESQIWAGLVVGSYLGIPSTFDVFDADGDYLGSVSLPPGSSVLDVVEGRVLLRLVGDLGQALVEVRRIAS